MRWCPTFDHYLTWFLCLRWPADEAAPHLGTRRSSDMSLIVTNKEQEGSRRSVHCRGYPNSVSVRLAAEMWVRRDRDGDLLEDTKTFY